MLVVEVTDDSRRVGYLRIIFFVEEAEFSGLDYKIFDDLNLFAMLCEAGTEMEVSPESCFYSSLFIEKGVIVFYYIITLASELWFFSDFF